MNKTSLFFVSLSFLLLISFHSNALHSASFHRQSRTSTLRAKNPAVKTVISKLNHVPESRQVIQRVIQEGPITVDLVSGMSFGAMWENGDRKISINARDQRDQGLLLRHILFELHNALCDSEYEELYTMALNREISCDAYVETVEKIEYENMIKTVSILEKGIALGLFPSSARWEIIYDFATHYKIQQLTGHSLSIAQEFQEMSWQNSRDAYRGTVRNLNRMSHRQKMTLVESLANRYFRSLGDDCSSISEI